MLCLVLYTDSSICQAENFRKFSWLLWRLPWLLIFVDLYSIMTTCNYAQESSLVALILFLIVHNSGHLSI